MDRHALRAMLPITDCACVSMDRHALRAMLPITDEMVYLNTGASGPVTTRVQEAATAAIHRQALAADPYAVAAEITQDTREQIAGIIRASPEAVAFTQSTTARGSSRASWRRTRRCSRRASNTVRCGSRLSDNAGGV
jgi:selenocysteine lyase/cysteine desulfurase